MAFSPTDNSAAIAYKYWTLRQHTIIFIHVFQTHSFIYFAFIHPGYTHLI